MSEDTDSKDQLTDNQDHSRLLKQADEWNNQITRERHFFQNYFFNRLSSGLGFRYLDFLKSKAGSSTYTENVLEQSPRNNFFRAFKDFSKKLEKYCFVSFDFQLLPLCFPFAWTQFVIDFNLFLDIDDTVRVIDNNFRNVFARAVAIDNLTFSVVETHINVADRSKQGCFVGLIFPSVSFDNADPSKDSVEMRVEIEQRTFNPHTIIHNPQSSTSSVNQVDFFNRIAIDRPFTSKNLENQTWSYFWRFIWLLVCSQMGFWSTGFVLIYRELNRLHSQVQVFDDRTNIRIGRLANFQNQLNTLIDKRNNQLRTLQSLYEAGDPAVVLQYNQAVLTRIEDSDIGGIELSYEHDVLGLKINNLLSQSNFPTVGRFEFDTNTRKIIDILLDTEVAEAEYWGYISQVIMRYLIEVYQANQNSVIKYISVKGFVDVRGQANGLLQHVLVSQIEVSTSLLNNIDIRNINPHETYRMLGGENFLTELNTFRWRSRITNRTNRGYQFEPHFMNLV